MKGWKTHSRPDVVQAYQQKKLDEQGYVAIPDDALADRIWLWWKNVGNRKGFLAGTVSSSCQVADYVREHFLVRPRKDTQWKCSLCDEDCDDYYMVEDDVWNSVMPSKKGYLHLRCLEEKLARKLVIEDFKQVKCNLAIRFAYEMGKRT